MERESATRGQAKEKLLVKLKTLQEQLFAADKKIAELTQDVGLREAEIGLLKNPP